MIQLLIARHGNTFDKGDIIRRVGKGTDLPLSQCGQQQAKKLGIYLQQHHPDITAVYASTLKRTIETAQLALDTMNLNLDITQTNIFDEIDYGPDEGKPETDVIARLGEAALKKWDQDNVVPDGWKVSPASITNNWQAFAIEMQKKFNHKTILVITSNGNARFAPQHKVKLSTGAISLLTIKQNHWTAEYTNQKPT